MPMNKVKPQKKISKKKLRALQREAQYAENIDRFLNSEGRLPHGVWLRGTNYRQKVPAGLALRCPFDKKAKDVEEHTKKRWTVKNEENDLVSIGHFTVSLPTINWDTMLGLRWLLPSDQYKIIKCRKQARQNRLKIKQKTDGVDQAQK